jgi:hypothetical protein
MGYGGQELRPTLVEWGWEIGKLTLNFALYLQ